MELLRLKKRLELARRGHKLLQDKLEGLIKDFMPLVEHYVSLRRKVDALLPAALSLFGRAAADADDELLRTSLGQTGLAVGILLKEEKKGPVLLPVLTAHFERDKPFYSLLSTPRSLDKAVSSLDKVFPILLQTVEKEESVRRLALEIERTRRRVNALEYILIPRLVQARKSIQAKLDEDERASRVRNMKVKELLEKAAASQSPHTGGG